MKIGRMPSTAKTWLTSLQSIFVLTKFEFKGPRFCSFSFFAWDDKKDAAKLEKIRWKREKVDLKKCWASVQWKKNASSRRWIVPFHPSLGFSSEFEKQGIMICRKLGFFLLLRHFLCPRNRCSLPWLTVCLSTTLQFFPETRQQQQLPKSKTKLFFFFTILFNSLSTLQLLFFGPALSIDLFVSSNPRVQK